MNDKMFDIIGQADEKYLREAEGTPQMRIKHKSRISARIVAVVAAAVCLTSVGAFAAYKGIMNRDSVGQFYDSSAMDSMESKGYAVGKTVENEHFRLTVESVLADSHSLRVMLTAEALDEQGDKYMKEIPMIATDIGYKDDNKLVHSGLVFQNFDYVGYEGRVAPKKYENGKPVSLFLDVDLKDNDASRTQLIDLNRPLLISFMNEKWQHKDQYDPLFNGLSFTVDKPNQAKTVELTADDGTKASISEFNVIAPIEVKGDVQKNPDLMNSVEIKNAKIVFKDSTTLNILDDGKTNSMSFTCIKDESDSKVTNLEACFSLRSLIDPEKVDHLEFEGKTYKVK